MEFADFLPYVAPAAIGCPRDMLLQQTRLAAIEFCSKTGVWREDLPALLADGFSTEYALALDDQVEVDRLLLVTVQAGTGAKDEAVVVTPLEGRQALRDGTTDRVAWTDARRSVFLSPAPALDSRIAVTASLKPSNAAFSFDDEVFAHHAEDIAQGAIARLLRMPAGTWINHVLSLDYEARFRERIDDVKTQAQRGFGRRSRGPWNRWL